MADEWQTQKFRQSVVTKINDMIQSNSLDPSKNATVMENHIFKKAKNREEYLGLVAKLLIHFREMNKVRPQSGGQQATNSDMGASSSSAVQDPINALQNLAVQGNRNPQMMQQMAQNSNNQVGPNSVVGGNASNLLQTLTQPRPTNQAQNVAGIRNQILNPQMAGGPINNNMGNFNPGMGMNNLVGGGNQAPQMGGGVLPNQMQGGQMQMQSIQQNQAMSMQQMPMSNQINMGMNHPQLNQMMNRIGVNQNQMSQNMANMNQSDMNNVINNNQVMNQGGQLNQQQSSNMNQIINVQGIAGQKPTGPNMCNNANNSMFQSNRNVGQFLRQSPSPTVSSPAGSVLTSQQQQIQSNSQMIPSPALVPTSSPQMANMLVNQRNLRQSPNGPLNTPGQVAGSSPFNPQEDQLYREKYKQLTKYIDPLKRMVAKIGNDDVEKITKMNKLLEILCNPHQRIPLETLLKCEKALEKMDFKSCMYPFPAGYQVGSNNALFEAVNSSLLNPIGNHTLQRTFRPCLEALFGSDIKSFPSASKQLGSNVDDNPFSSSEIPHVLQGEIARLDQKFKLSLDSSCQNSSKIIKLICCIDDKRLPCVPPLIVCISENYPLTSPNCSLTHHEYSSTPFLLAVQNTLMARISKLPKIHSLSHLLDTWEMSIRHACSPKNVTSIEQVFCF